MTRYTFPIRPMTPIDVINRRAAATGSMRYAQLSAHADYNGHHVNVYFNDYRGYWLAEYTWAGRNVLTRGTFEQALAAAKREYDRGAAGSSVHIGINDKAPESVMMQAALSHAAGAVVEDGTPDYGPGASWWTVEHDAVRSAMDYEQWFPGSVGIAANWHGDTIEEFEAVLKAYHQRGRRVQA